MSNRPYFIVNVEVAIKDKKIGKYLLIRRSLKEDHSAGTLSLPGGKLDQLAISPMALEKTIMREVREEVGLELHSVAYVESKSFVMDTGEWCLSICLYSDVFSGTAHALSKDEVDDVVWLAPSELSEQVNCPPWTQQSIRQAEQLVAR